MKIQIKKEDMVKGLQTVQNAISQKNTLPILSNLLLETEQENIKLTATDLDIGIISTIPCKIEEQGAITIPAKKLYDIVKELPGSEYIDISLKKNNVLYLDCGTSHFKIICLPKDEFPEIPKIKEKDQIVISKVNLKRLLSLTIFAVSKDESRYILNGVLCIINQDTIEVVATDGRRLAVSSCKLLENKDIDKQVIIPVKTLQEVYRIISDSENENDDIIILFGETQVFFKINKTTVITRLIEGDFPNYKNVIPKESGKKLSIPREALLSATKRAALFTNQDSLAVKFDINKSKVIVSKNAPYIGEVKEEVSAEYNAEQVSIGFNPVYIMDVLKVLDEKNIVFEVNEEDKPVVVRIGKEYIYVVLPMQII
ncbi:MAG: DNA polymerase III subunit beta [Candidatus Omnitrophica bacterium]|nr:DNA polymerase III subunit beta [Candidatus Omnitrophota bacterium]